ncbi:hypothetical protein [Streptosporangium sp. OZ121]|uniref:hypothetical protein n=1 Tax=Streptosporangium sp. OZ121 TaxID=3444183 RepID=UPI003F7915FD
MSHSRVETLLRLERLPVITAIVPTGLACSGKVRKRCHPALLREEAHTVTAWPSAMRRPP